MQITTINPANGQEIRQYEEDTLEKINLKIMLCNNAFLHWSKMSFIERANHLEDVCLVLEERKVYLAELMALEMGKPIVQGISEIEKCIWVTRFYAAYGEGQLRNLEIPTEMEKSYVAFKPLGIIFSIMPWNFPFWQVFRFVAPALMAGNSVLLKHSPNTTQCAIEIEKIFINAGLPNNVVTNLIISQESVPEFSQKIIEHPYISAVTMTGSSYAGSQVAEIAGKNLKKCVMELGGSDPYIIFGDADLEKAAEACTIGRLINSGQSCIAAKRIIVHKNIYEEFLDKFTKAMQAKKVGNPFEEDVFVGPLSRKDLRDTLHNQVLRSIELGAVAHLGCEIPEGDGFYYPVSILTNVKKGMPAFDEEIFGPVASIITFETEEEAIMLANEHIYGLGAAIFSANVEKAENIGLNLINTGTVQINDFVRSDPRLPFGGVKQSGFGRELAVFGIREFVNVKTVCVK
jgi:succinate-semialdehyde dehydrogenase/glutarate-semialdehyde dehydrogenase